ncbi:MAG: YgaP-like transmembrane domain [Bacillota bacterium]
MHLDWEKNLGAADRIIRVLIGLLLIGLTSTGIIKGWWAAAAGVLALIQFIDAFFAY